MNRNELKAAKAKMVAAGFSYLCTIMADKASQASGQFGVVYIKGMQKFYLNKNTIDALPIASSNRPGDMAAEYAAETGMSYSQALVACNMD